MCSSIRLEGNRRRGWRDTPIHSEERKIKKKEERRFYRTVSREEKRGIRRGGQGVCPPMLICPERVMGGQRRSGEGCWDVFKCAGVLSNVNLS